MKCVLYEVALKVHSTAVLLQSVIALLSLAVGLFLQHMNTFNIYLNFWKVSTLMLTT